MTLRPGGKTWSIQEQIIEDLTCGLTFQFKVGSDGLSRLTIFGDILPLGNRDIVFDENGEEAGGGTAMCGSRRATWIQEEPMKSSICEIRGQ